MAEFQGATCERVTRVDLEGSQDVSIAFSAGTELRAQYWRLGRNGRQPAVSSFDHGQMYGLPKPVDAFEVLDQTLRGRTVVRAAMDESTGDLRFDFTGEVRLEVFNFTAYETWELRFPDGAREFSNHALHPKDS